ncbi:MAG: hypothetical protein U1E53_30415 [Dongiaceae bacterium]
MDREQVMRRRRREMFRDKIRMHVVLFAVFAGISAIPAALAARAVAPASGFIFAAVFLLALLSGIFLIRLLLHYFIDFMWYRYPEMMYDGFIDSNPKPPPSFGAAFRTAVDFMLLRHLFDL